MGYMILLSAVSSVLLVGLCVYIVIASYRHDKAKNSYIDDLAARYDKLFKHFKASSQLTLEALKILRFFVIW